MTGAPLLFFFFFSQPTTDLTQDSIVQSFGEKFKPLSKYIQTLSREDLLKFPKEDLINLVLPEDRLLMKLFIIEHLSDVERKPMPSYPQPALEIFSRNGHLDLKGKLSTVMFPQFKGKLRLDSLESITVTKSNVTSADLSCNNLLDGDVPIIQNLPNIFPCLSLLDLSYNQITSKVDTAALRALLRRVTLIIVGNPLATIDGKEFFAGLTKEELGKLIWIPQNWLKARKWVVLIPDKEKQEFVFTIHERFYER
jgi:hypothetical protein